MEFPFAGSRMLQGLLVQEGFKVGRLHVATLMKRMGRVGERHWFERTREGGALYRRPNTSRPARPCGAWLRHDATRSVPTCCENCRSPGLTRSPSRACRHALPGNGAMDITYTNGPIN